MNGTMFRLHFQVTDLILRMSLLYHMYGWIATVRWTTLGLGDAVVKFP
ncbi:hypothetical protein [Blautia hydrogenotrophica]|nr:hypothetical protein [Blautia hydrogenotrophica]